MTIELNREPRNIVELWLLRHGQTTANAEGLLSGWNDVELTEEGLAQARRVRPKLEHLKFDAVYSSDLRRAVTTARLAYGEPIQERRLRETHFGDYDGMPIKGLDPHWVRDLYIFKDFSAPNGESKAQTHRRVAEFINTLKPGRYLLVCHGGVIRCLTNALGEDRFIDNTEILRIDWTHQLILE